jgi:hypothetical protein
MVAPEHGADTQWNIELKVGLRWLCDADAIFYPVIFFLVKFPLWKEALTCDSFNREE